MQPRGFVALISASIIAAILLIVAASGSLTGFMARGDVLDAELKERSVAVADACVDQATLLITQTPTYAGSVTRVLSSIDSCQGSIATAGSNKSLRIQATSSVAVTNLQITLRTSDASVVSWQEVATY